MITVAINGFGRIGRLAFRQVFDDPDIAIDWPIDERVAIHSERDLRLQSFREYLKNPMEI